MADAPIITINDIPAHAFHLTVPSKGVWFARLRVQDVEASVSMDPSGAEIKVGDLTLTGTVTRNHLDMNEQAIDVTGGAAGWRNTLPSKPYINDGGVDAKLVVSDLADETKETLDGFDVSESTLGDKYIRLVRTASLTLIEAIGSDIWWVDYEGKTQVATERESTTYNDPDDFILSDYDPDHDRCVFDSESFSTIKVGDKLKHELWNDEEKTIVRLEVSADNDQATLQTCWFSEHNDVQTQIEAAVARVVDQRAVTLLEYKITGQSGDRLDLEPVDEDNPPLSKVEIWAGHPGMQHKELVGMRVLVGFIQGKRARPAVMAFAPPSGPDFIPLEITQTTTDKVTIATTDTEINTTASLKIATVDTTIDSTSTFAVTALDASFDDTSSFKVTCGSPMIEASASGVKLAGGFDAVTLNLLVKLELQKLALTITSAFISVGAGLAANGALGAVQMASYVPGEMGATMTKAT